MNAIKKEKTIVHRNDGFSLIEALIALAITLVVLAAAFGVFRSVTHSGSAANQVYEVTTDTQAALNLIRRDLQKTDSLPETGIPLSGTSLSEIFWSGDRCFNGNTEGQVDCSDGDNSYKIADDSTILLIGTSDTGRTNSTGGYVFDAVTPTKVNGNDAVIIIYEDDFARNISAGTTLEDSGFSSFELVTTNTVLQQSIRDGDFIILRDQPGVLGEEGVPVLQRINCTNDICKGVILLNKSSAVNTDARIDILEGDVNVSILRRVTYYLKEDENDGKTWLMRQVNSRPAEKLVSGVKEFNLSYDVVDTDAAGNTRISSPDDSANPSKQTEFFYDETAADSGPRRVMDIRRVNVDITLDSDKPAIPGKDDTVKRTQATGMAVRRSFQPSPTPPPPPPPPPDPPPDSRPGDFNCGYGSSCSSISCKLKCVNWSGAGCEIYFLPLPHSKYDAGDTWNYNKVTEATSWYNNGNTTLINGTTIKGSFTLDGNGSKSFGSSYAKNYVDPSTNVFWIYYTYTDNKGKQTAGPIPMIWSPDSCNNKSNAYADCDRYPGLDGCVALEPIPQ